MKNISAKKAFTVTALIVFLLITGILQEFVDISGTNDSWFDASNFGYFFEIGFLLSMGLMIYFAIISFFFLRNYFTAKQFREPFTINSITAFAMIVLWILYFTV